MRDSPRVAGGEVERPCHYLPRSFLLFSNGPSPSAKDRPLAARARRSWSSALGPIPCNRRTSASLSVVSCSRRTNPAPASARRAGLARTLGRSLSRSLPDRVSRPPSAGSSLSRPTRWSTSRDRVARCDLPPSVRRSSAILHPFGLYLTHLRINRPVRWQTSLTLTFLLAGRRGSRRPCWSSLNLRVSASSERARP